MATARFRFHGELADFLPRERRNSAFAYACARAATLKNAIEALGVPHTEAAEITVNGARATLDRIVREGDTIEVHPWNPANQGPTTFFSEKRGLSPNFLADAHLGGLARFLRMLGYDTLHENALGDAEIRRLAWQERRIVLTRDRELLKCREILRGAYVHALKPEAQLREVAARYGLAAQARPFTLCLSCNVALEPASEAQVRAYALPVVLERYRVFHRCPACERVFWEGSHFARMREALHQLQLPLRPAPK
ncbi:MAG: twitching motility protein PilT [Betaproteobacteria bacterium]|nr:twitching motility protein PilT [Betaproteobacteria bacterium]